MENDKENSDNKTMEIQSTDEEAIGSQPVRSEISTKTQTTVLKRKCYSMSMKIAIASQYQANVNGRGFASVAKLNGIDSKTIRRWWNKLDKMKEQISNRTTSIRHIKRLPGGGRKSAYPEVDQHMYQWLQQRNNEGLRVSDKYLQFEAKIFANEHAFSNFSASPGWLSRFKGRFDIVSRRHTTTRSVPENADSIALTFMHDVQQFILTKNVQLKNILNMDQVPRYYESTSDSTLTVRGSRQVLLRKASTSHKRFTATFTISAGGRMLKPHVLFSKLKNLPKANSSVFTALNQTGMWSELTLKEYMEEIILKRPETSLYREPVLLLIDHYGPHVKLVESQKYEKYNVYVKLIPPRMTSLLQPLDVCLNRSFQSSYKESYDQYIQTALKDPKMMSKSGHPKAPSHELASNWVWNWASNVSSSLIEKAFVVCGISTNGFHLETLHEPLRKLCEEGNDKDDMHNILLSLIHNEDDVDCEDFNICVPEESDASFYRNIYRFQSGEGSFYSWLSSYTQKVIDYIKHRWRGLIDNVDEIKIRRGEILSGAEMNAVSSIESLKIIITEYDEKGQQINEFSYDVENSRNVLELVQCGDLYATKIVET